MTSFDFVSTEPKQAVCRLSIRRLCAYLRTGGKAYDQTFHEGLNVIQSKGNTTGKTAVCDFIFYLLGGDVDAWSKDAVKCGFVIGEVSINGGVMTLRRYLPMDARERTGIDFYFGDLAAAEKTIDGWTRHPYQRSGSIDSFSQVLFKLIGFPEAKSDAKNNITMHGILRLCYSDQETAPKKIFRDQQWNDAETRQTIGEVLLGYDDFQLHQKRQEIKRLEAEKNDEASRLSAIKTILDSAYPNMRLSDFPKLEAQKIEELRLVADEIRQIDAAGNSKRSAGVQARKSLKTATALSKQYADLKAKSNELNENLRLLNDDIADSKLFIQSLRGKLAAIEEAQLSMRTFGRLHFERCPACLAPIAEVANGNNHCGLCKNPVSAEDVETRRLRVRHEISNQINESDRILTIKNKARDRIESEIARCEALAAKKQFEFSALTSSPNVFEQRLRELYSRIGYLEKHIEDIKEKRRLADRIAKVEEHISTLNKTIGIELSLLQGLADSRQERRQRIESTISEIAIDILHRDIPSDDSLVQSKALEIDFGKDRLVLDGQTHARLSASTTAFLKNSFFVSMFLASLDDGDIRLPRFMMLDGIEDKGIVADRVQNFHRIIADEISKRPFHGQIIITTSLSHQLIDEGRFGVGPVYTPDQRVLDVGENQSSTSLA